MLILAINKILILIYVLAVINTIRHTYYFIQAYLSTYNDDEPVKYIVSDKSLLIVGLSIAYIITGIITGITL
jgi:hypothetical protein